MDIVAIDGVPIIWSLKGVFAGINKGEIKWKFEMLNFGKSKNNMKTAYIRLKNISANRAVQVINTFRHPKANLVAYIPNEVPELAISKSRKKPAQKKRFKQVPLSKKERNYLKKKLANPKKQELISSPQYILTNIHKQLLEEITKKYGGLQQLSKTTGDKLLDEIAMTFFRRVKKIMDEWKKPSGDALVISKAYREEYPHSSDFQLIQSTLHKIEDASGKPHTDLKEEALIEKDSPFLQPDEQQRVTRLSLIIEDKLCNKFKQHIDELVTEPEDGDTPQMKATKRVRRELQKFGNSLDSLIKVVILNIFPPPLHKDIRPVFNQMMRLYGEPALPPQEKLISLIQKYNASSVSYSHHLHNMFRFAVPQRKYTECLELDGMVVDGCKLVVRQAAPMEYQIKPMLLARLMTAFTNHTPNPALQLGNSAPQLGNSAPKLGNSAPQLYNPASKPSFAPKQENADCTMDCDDSDDWGPYAAY